MKNNIIIISPLLIVGLGNLLARLLGSILYEWAWVPITFILWIIWSGFVIWGTDKRQREKWYKNKVDRIRFLIISIIVGVIPFGTAIAAGKYLRINYVLISWLVFALINPVIEEFYWRGLLLTYTQKWKLIIRIAYSSLLYALSHPLIWGVNSHGNRSIIAFISILVMGIIWAYVFEKTRSLRYTILSHLMVDMLNMSVIIFLNLWIPPTISF